MLFNAQPVAEVREARERWVTPPTASATADLCDEDIREWVMAEPSQTIVFVEQAHSTRTSDLQVVCDQIGPPESLTLKHRFQDLAQQWADETGHLSSPNQKMLHPSYKAILGMAQEHKNEVIDLLLEDMQKNRRQWFWALSYLTQANPIKPEDAGRMDRMINAWVRWGETRVRR